MRPARIALGVLLVGTLALPLTSLASSRPKTPLKRTKEYELVSYVVEGEVKTLRYADADGKPASAGPRFTLDLAVSVVRKGKGKGSPARGDTLSVRGWAEGKQKQRYIPSERDEVLAFLKRKADGTYEPLVPTGFSNLRAAPRSPGPEPRKKEKPAGKKPVEKKPAGPQVHEQTPSKTARKTPDKARSLRGKKKVRPKQKDGDN
jgi:hypothetical protein